MTGKLTRNVNQLTMLINNKTTAIAVAFYLAFLNKQKIGLVPIFIIQFPLPKLSLLWTILCYPL